MVLLAFKIGAVALKRVCKPLGYRIKREIMVHPTFRQLIVNVLQTKHPIPVAEVDISKLDTHKNSRHLCMGMILPVYKLGALTVRSICKPIGNRIKKEAGLHSTFRQAIISIAQANHRLTTTAQRYIHNHATDVVIRPLNEERAVQVAADLLGELFMFMVAATAVIYEVQRNSKSEAKKLELRKQELEEMKQRNEELSRELKCLKQKAEELQQELTKEPGFGEAILQKLKLI